MQDELVKLAEMFIETEEIHKKILSIKARYERLGIHEDQTEIIMEEVVKKVNPDLHKRVKQIEIAHEILDTY